jgi:hypothetical protein
MYDRTYIRTTKKYKESSDELLFEKAKEFINGEFDPGSGRTLAACLTHASRGLARALAHGCVTRRQSAPHTVITGLTAC